MTFSIPFYILLFLSVLWFCFMTWLSHQNGSETAETSRHLAEELSAIFHSQDMHQLNGKLRRAAHIIVFAVLTVLVLLTMMVGEITDRWIAVCLICLWAWLDEATKPLVQGRHFQWMDVGLNLIGVGIGCVVMTVVITVAALC